MQDVSEECMRAGQQYSKGLSVGGAGGKGGPGFCPQAPGKYSQAEGGRVRGVSGMTAPLSNQLMK